MQSTSTGESLPISRIARLSPQRRILAGACLVHSCTTATRISFMLCCLSGSRSSTSLMPVRGGPGALLWHHGRLVGSGRQADCRARSTASRLKVLDGHGPELLCRHVRRNAQTVGVTPSSGWPAASLPATRLRPKKGLLEGQRSPVS
jgi:hypothetical protein